MKVQPAIAVMNAPNFFIFCSTFILFCNFISLTTSTSSIHEHLLSSDSRWSMGPRPFPPRYDHERDELEPDDDDVVHHGHHEYFNEENRRLPKRYSSENHISRRSSNRRRRHPEKYSLSQFDEEYIPKRSQMYHRRRNDDDEEEEPFSRPPHRHMEDEYPPEPVTLPRTYRRTSRGESDFMDSEISPPNYKMPRSIRSHRMRNSYHPYGDDMPVASHNEERESSRSPPRYSHHDDFERPSSEGLGYSRTYYKKFLPHDDHDISPPPTPFKQQRQPLIIDEQPHESYASFLQGMYGNSPFGSKTSASDPAASKPMNHGAMQWPGLSLDNLPILDPKPEFDKSFMENFLASNNKHFSTDSGHSLHSSETSNSDSDDDDNEEEESSRSSRAMKKERPNPPPRKLSSLRSFMPFSTFGLGNLFGGSGMASSASKNNERVSPPRTYLSDEASRISNLDDAIDEDEDQMSSGSEASCDSHESSDSTKHVKFASPEIEIVTPTAKSAQSSSFSLSSPSLIEETTTNVPTTQNVSSNAM